MSTTNDQIYAALLDIKQDIGGLKASSELFVKGLENHSGRIVKLEDSVSKQKGAARVWGIVSTLAGAIVGGVVGNYRGH